MLKMSKSSREFLEENCPQVFKESNLRQFLLALDEYITMYGLDENDNMTDLGRKAQSVYDEVYMCN